MSCDDIIIEVPEEVIVIEMTPEGADGKSLNPRGDWNSSAVYAYRDMVAYQGNSYIALKNVPAGTLPTDTEYWMINAAGGNTTYWGNIHGTLSNQTDLVTALASKADANAVYTKTEADALLSDKADADSVYTKAEADALLDAKADANSVYTKTEADALLADKADKNSVYTKTEADALLAGKANASDVYTKTQVDDALDLKADKADSYTKDELDGIFDGIDNALDSKADADSVYTKAQTNTLLAAKANTADLGTMAGVNDAPSDGKEYARKNGQWAEVVGGSGSTAWGEITGDLDDQTDLKNALDAKANTADLGALADQDTVDYETEVTNKPTLGTMSAESASDYYDKTEVNDLINASGVVAELDASGSIATFETNLAENLSRLNVSIDPVQDLHGYDNPWPAGGGKNILPITLALLKSLNTQGTWSNNVYTYNDVTFTVSTNTEGYVTKIVLNGTASASAPLVITETTTHNDWLGCIMNGAPSGSSGSTSYIAGWNETDSTGIGVFDFGSGATIPNTLQDKRFRLYIGNPIGAVNSNRAFYPMIRLSSVSDATFAPYSNVCPISGHSSATVTRTGKNMFDGAYKYHSTDALTSVKAGETYTISTKHVAGEEGLNYCFYNGSSYFGDASVIVSGSTATYGTKTFTVPAGATHVNVYSLITSTNSNGYLSETQIELGSSATAYESPHVENVTIALGSTVYGAQLDVLAGTLTVDRAMVTFDGSNDEVINDASSPNAYRARIEIPSDSITWTSASTKSGKLLSNEFEEITNDDSYNGDVGIHYRITGTHEIIVGFGSMGVSSSNIRTWLASNPLVVVYYLATPTVITGLTPAQIQALQGLNNVWADTGDVAVSYFNNSTAEAITDVKQMIASTETSMTATRNYTSGSLIIVGPALLKATSNISSGAALVIGTNCVRTTLEEWILSLIV